MSDSYRAPLALLIVFLLGLSGALFCRAFHWYEPRTAVGAPAESLAPVVNLTRRAVALPATWTVTPTFTPSLTPSPRPPTATPTPRYPTPLPSVRPTRADIDVRPNVRVHVTGTLSTTLFVPTAVPLLPIPEEAVTILLLGSDKRPDREHWRTDAIQYVVIYPEVPSAAILSIPRDLYVYIPGYSMNRINFAHMYGETNGYEGGGPGLLNQTLLHNLGVSADYYVKVGFDGLIGLVDAMDGIDVPVHCRLRDYWPYPDEEGQYYRIALEPGVHHMDGELALWFSRSRVTTSIFSRERRQQQVLEAIWREARQASLVDAAAALYEQTGDVFETDLGLGNIVSLAMTAAQLDPVDVKRRNIGWGQVIPYTTPGGGGVYLPIWREIEPIITDVLAPPAANRAAQEAVSVEVWNGTEHAGWDLLAADRLYRQGFVPIIGQPDRRDYTQTQIIYFDANTKGTGLTALQSLFRVSQDNLILQANAGSDVKARLIVGGDYVTCWQR